MWRYRKRPLGALWTMVTTVMFILLFSYIILKLTSRRGKRILQGMGLDVELSNYLMLMVGSAYLAHASFFRFPAKRVLLHDRLTEYLTRRKLTLPQLVQAVSLSCEEMVIQCALGPRMMSRDECCRAMVQVETRSGLCFTRKADDGFIQVGNGEWMGYTVVLNTSHQEPELAEELVDPIRWLKRGAQITITNTLTQPSLLVTEQGTILPSQTFTSITLSLAKINREGLAQGPAVFTTFPCVQREQEEDKVEGGVSQDSHSNSQSSNPIVNNCPLEVSKRCISKICGCSSYWLHDDDDDDNNNNDDNDDDGGSPEKTTEDGGDGGGEEVEKEIWKNKTMEMRKCVAEVSGECRLVCREDVFTGLPVTQPLLPQHLLQLQRRQRLRRNEGVAVVSVYYPRKSYSQVVVWRKGFLDLMGDVGGVSGLLLGCSLVTILEIFIFILSCCKVLVGMAATRIRRAFVVVVAPGGQ
ncbi:hypothetical protein Pcinc_030612 [Petrolisthes cinctipes]|uniref:Uncharacterized protein n=1 Tax=Petrolisthes cinctipes TaxID=88211 RepID=A0AAE1K478_PETCI|nr:hypothetical protein Pcinc_030612 [Petrolisthes cinctipes]